MGCSSVTGVSGVGSAEGGFRGPGNGRNSYVSLISPHVITAETVTMSGATQLITFTDPVPSPAGLLASHTYTTAANPITGYIVVFGNASAANAPWVSDWRTDANGNFAAFTITGTSTNVVSYAVISTGRTPAAPLL